MATLALGIGANTAMFSVVDAVLLEALPHPDPGELVRLYEVTPEGTRFSFSAANVVDLRRSTESLEGAVAYDDDSFTLISPSAAERIPGMRVSAGFFEVLETRFQRGRPFTPEEDVAGAEPVVVVAHRFWRDRLGGDPAAVGRTIVLDEVPHTVVGVAPPGFTFLDRDFAVWVPIRFDGTELQNNRGGHMYSALGRLAPDADLDTLRAELETLGAALGRRYPATNAGWSLTAAPLRESLVGNVRTPLMLLLGAVALVLLTACANVANLVLARSQDRNREISLRAALGASRSRIVRQFLTESLLLATLGGGVGIVAAYGGLRLLTSSLGGFLPRASNVEIDLGVLGFTLLATLLSGILVGLAPTLRASRTDLQRALQEGGAGRQATADRSGFRSGLLVAEVALAVTLVLGAGLLTRSLWHLQAVDPGFDPERRLGFRLYLPEARYPDDAAIRTFYQTLESELAALPGVTAVGSVGLLPMGSSQSTTMSVAGEPDNEGSVQFRLVTPGYIEAMGIPVVRGRGFSERDGPDTTAVTVVNETFAERRFPTREPVGRRLTHGWESLPDRFEIVGVAGDVRSHGAHQPAPPTVYWLQAQANFRRSMSVVVAGSDDPLALTGSVQSTVRRVDPRLAVYQVEPLAERVARTLDRERFSTVLMGLFAGVALLLGALGIYGVTAYSVSRRTREVGIRIAVGADPSGVVRMLVRESMLRVAAGIVVGMLGFLAAGRFMESLVHGVGLRDPLTVSVVVVTLTVVALAASFAPARRATRVDPIAALESE